MQLFTKAALFGTIGATLTPTRRLIRPRVSVLADNRMRKNSDFGISTPSEHLVKARQTRLSFNEKCCASRRRSRYIVFLEAAQRAFISLHHPVPVLANERSPRSSHSPNSLAMRRFYHSQQILVAFGEVARMDFSRRARKGRATERDLVECESILRYRRHRVNRVTYPHARVDVQARVRTRARVRLICAFVIRGYADLGLPGARQWRNHVFG